MTTLTDWIGLAAAIVSTLCWLPQSVKLFKERQSAGVSLATNALLLGAVILWMIYGSLIEAWPIVLSNGISCLLITSIVVMKIRLDARAAKT